MEKREGEDEKKAKRDTHGGSVCDIVARREAGSGCVYKMRANWRAGRGGGGGGDDWRADSGRAEVKIEVGEENAWRRGIRYVGDVCVAFRYGGVIELNYSRRVLDRSSDARHGVWRL